MPSCTTQTHATPNHPPPAHPTPSFCAQRSEVAESTPHGKLKHGSCDGTRYAPLRRMTGGGCRHALPRPTPNHPPRTAILPSFCAQRSGVAESTPHGKFEAWILRQHSPRSLAQDDAGPLPPCTTPDPRQTTRPAWPTPVIGSPFRWPVLTMVASSRPESASPCPQPFWLSPSRPS